MTVIFVSTGGCERFQERNFESRFRNEHFPMPSEESLVTIFQWKAFYYWLVKLLIFAIEVHWWMTSGCTHAVFDVRYWYCSVLIKSSCSISASQNRIVFVKHEIEKRSALHMLSASWRRSKLCALSALSLTRTALRTDTSVLWTVKIETQNSMD